MNTRKLSMILSIALIFAASSAQASNWVLIDGDASTDSSTSVDKDSIKVSNGMTNFQEKLDYKTPQGTKSGKPYDYLVMGVVANCHDQTLAMTSGQAFNRDGSVVDYTKVASTEWKFDKPEPNTSGAIELNLVCASLVSHPYTR